jgi:MraZ protein
MLLTGTFLRSMDEKQRVALPKRIREDLEAQKTGGLFLTPWNDESLALFTEETLTTLAARLSAASPTSEEVRAFNRLFYARAERVELDDQGRFRIPAGLVKLATLDREVTLVGVQDHLEIWNRGRWETYLANKSNDYDRIAMQAFDAGRLR